MERRTFIKLASLSSLYYMLPSCTGMYSDTVYDITVHSNRKTGHLIRSASTMKAGETIKKDVLIIGAGIAGLSAACSLKTQDILVCELAPRTGGSSSSFQHNGAIFSQGAHYDLAYPNNYGTEVLSLLERLEVIKYNPNKLIWDFRDQQHIIPAPIESQCSVFGVIREDVIEDNALKKQFMDLLKPFENEMMMPTRLIKEEYRHLDKLSFLDFIKEGLNPTPELIQSLDYLIKDDFGAGCSEVSALAGIHYFKCRPYDTKSIELFSPPQGNNYFIDKLEEQLKPDQVLTGHLAYSIEKQEEGFSVKVIDIEKKEVKTVEAKQIIYAGQKHGIKHIFPQDAALFEENSYAPWVVINIVLKERVSDDVFWQNEFLGENAAFLGFVDSESQDTKGQPQVLTAYHCFPQSDRNALVDIEKNPQVIVSDTINKISDYLGNDVASVVDKVFVKLMGHAMPIPYPGYLFNDKNQTRSEKDLVYAGVDNSRLPLLFEAMDSGIQAAQLLSS